MHHHHQHGHDHHHHHHHDHSHSLALTDSTLNRAFKLGIILNVGFVVAEIVFGILYNSMGLLSDAGHNLSDVFSLLLAMVAFRLMDRKPDEKHTYGYRKFTIQASFINAVVLLVAVGVILAESIEKLVHPVHVDGGAIAWVAGAGVLINGLTAWLFIRDKEKDLNVKGAYMHMLADTLVSVGVVVSGVVIRFTGWNFIDPIIGIVIALFIGWSTRSLLVESFRLSIDSVPEAINIRRLIGEMEKVEGVIGIHHIHVWAMSTSENAMTAHAVIENPAYVETAIPGMHLVAEKFGICHATIEVETQNHACGDVAVIASK